MLEVYEEWDKRHSMVKNVLPLYCFLYRYDITLDEFAMALNISIGKAFCMRRDMKTFVINYGNNYFSIVEKKYALMKSDIITLDTGIRRMPLR